ncbi:MAG: tetratricopeptide repeat protein [Chloroflexota bacterium]
MALNFGDLLSNALHEIKLHTRKKIGIIQDEIGYTFDPHLTGDAVESWRYRKGPPTLELLEQLAAAILTYGCEAHDRDWLADFLEKGQHPYIDAVCDRHFPPETAKSDDQLTKVKFPAPPIAAYAPPKLDQFVGRAAELDRFRSAFDQNKLALICGMAGIGKTTLATRLASEQPDQMAVFWHAFHDGNLNPFIRRIAGFLANHDRSDLWEMIESARREGIKPPDTETSLDTITAQLNELNVILCLDDLQYVDDDPQFGEFLSKLQTNEVPLIITARRFPSFLTARQQEITGLSEADVNMLLAERGIVLPDDQVADLHSYTGGNGAFLTLAAVVLKHAHDPADVIAKLAEIDNIERFLMEEVNDRLSANQQRLMEGVAILGGYPGTRDVLEDMLNQRDVRRTLQELTGQFLLITSEGDYGREYHQHSIIQAFYYDQPRRRMRRELHLRAAEFYETEELDQFKATFHYAKGEDGERATQIATKFLWQIVNQGMARPLAKLLDEVTEESLAQIDQFELWLTKGQLDTLLGDFDNAQEVLQKAAEKLQALPKTNETDVLKGRVCLHMAELLERQSPPEALTWAQRGLDIVPRSEKELTAALTVKTGTMMMHMGNWGGALETFETVSTNDLDKNQSLKAELWMNLGNVYANKEETFYLSEEFAFQALELSRDLRNHRQSCQILSNIAYIPYAQGNWVKAASLLEDALSIAKRIGSQTDILSTSTNLGRLYIDLGEFDLARKHLTLAISIGEPFNLHPALIAKINLSDLLNLEGKYQSAIDLLQELIEPIKAKNDQDNLAFIFSSMAEANLGLGNYDQASNCAENAIAMFRALGDSRGMGITWRVVGQIQAKNNNFIKALDAYNKSMELLNQEDKFQFAISQAAKGILLHTSDELGDSVSLLNSALGAFENLQAKHHIEWVDQHLTLQNRLAAN